MWDDSLDSDFESIEETNAPQVPIFPTDTAESLRAKLLILCVTGFVLQLQAKYFIPDKAVDLLVKFLYIFIKILRTFRSSQFCTQLANFFPQSLSCEAKTCVVIVVSLPQNRLLVIPSQQQ